MEVQDISKVMNAYISNQEMLGGALIVRKNDEIWSVQVGQGALRKLVPIDLHPTKFLPIV